MSGDLLHQHLSWLPFLVTLPISHLLGRLPGRQGLGDHFPLNFPCMITCPQLPIMVEPHRELCKIAHLWGASQPKGKRDTASSQRPRTTDQLL